MNVEMEPGRYVVAVSGGVDSCVLLDILVKSDKYELIVAHFDHGIRQDSGDDAKFVQNLAEQHGLLFVSEKGDLGAAASEATARAARYAFLYGVMAAQSAQAIVTAHHQDDLLETAIINILRGGGRKGLTALRDTTVLRRPLLGVSKGALLAYARENNLSWREDSTNTDTKYFRNYVRHNLLGRFSEADTAKLLEIIREQTSLNDEIDKLLENLLDEIISDNAVSRYMFACLPHQLAKEFMAAWLRANDLRDFDKRIIERLVIAGKVTKPGKQVDILHNVRMHVEKDRLALNGLER
jgi:tRNA(Ile)-lysidine synthetase-like protein